ncbi:flippase-like domain-containing protein [bacterium]|nr:flippase-like domain-containing protein [bacterium]MBU1651440.1 flippase-like domain-containing protein [bacterium]
MKVRIFVGLFLSLLFIYLSFWKPQIAGLFSGLSVIEAFFGKTRIDVNELALVLSEAHYQYLLVGIGLLMLSLFPRAERWRVLLRPVHSGIRYWPVYSAMNIGYMINNILPLRAGEILRAYFLGKSENISKSSVLATIVVERVFDLMAAMIVMSITLFFFPFPDWIRNGLFYIGGGLLALILFLVGLLVNTEWTLNFLRKVLKPIPAKLSEKIVKIVGSFASGLEVLRSSKAYWKIFGYTLILQVSYVGSVYATLLAFDLVDPAYPAIQENPLLASLVLLIIITVGVGIPSAPGAVGTFHGIVAFGVGLFGVPLEKAMGMAIALHLANYIPLTALGLVCFWSQQFSFSEIKSQFPKGGQKG